MFPPQLAHYFISWLTEPGDAVYDPFSGRGTVALEAVLQGRKSYSSDANPLAVVLSSAKTRVPSRTALLKRLDHLQDGFKSDEISLSNEPDNIAMLYNTKVLTQLVWLKSQLDRNNDVDCFWIAVILGMLHGNHGKNGRPRGFSISMPNTFAMAPGYVAKYIREHDLQKPDVDVFEMLKQRIARIDLPTALRVGGKSWTQDATIAPPGWLVARAPKLVFTSPPYLEVIKYGKYNWVRLWFLNETSASVDQKLMTSASLARYITFMTLVMRNLRRVVAPDGYVCLVIGDVRRGDDDINLAEEVWVKVLQPQGWYLHGIVADTVPTQHKVSRIWKNNSGKATKTDRLVIVSPTEQNLPEIISPSWEKKIAFTN